MWPQGRAACLMGPVIPRDINKTSTSFRSSVVCTPSQEKSWARSGEGGLVMNSVTFGKSTLQRNTCLQNN